MNADWCRLWHDMPTDPKWRVIARKSGRPLSEVVSVFVLMLTTASQADERGALQGWDDEDAGAALDIDAEAVTAIREAMQGRVLDGAALSGWERRQPKRERPQDVSTERVKAFRDRKRTETPCNATEHSETPREEERRGDREENSTHREVSGLDTPAALLGDERVTRYAFERKTIKLTLKDLRAWEAAYPHISVAGELHALDEWAGKQDNWFPAVSGALAKREREAVIAIEQAKATGMAKGTGPPAYRETRI